MKDEKKNKESAARQRRSLLKNPAAATIGLGAMSGGIEARAGEGLREGRDLRRGPSRARGRASCPC